MQEGDTGDSVKWLQYQLGLFFGEEYKLDRCFGSTTEKLVKKYQKKHQLQADGIAGKETIDSLKKIKETKKEKKMREEYKLTYYSLDDNDTRWGTSSNLTTSNFRLHPDLGCYTFNGKVVLAGADKAFARTYVGVCSWIHYWNPKERRSVELKINGKTYEGVVIDTCGAACEIEEDEHPILDVFFPNEQSAIDAGIDQMVAQVKY